MTFFPCLNRIVSHTVLLKCQIAFLKFTGFNNQVLVGCIPIPAIAVLLNLKSLKMASHLIRSIAITVKFSRVYDNFKCPYEKNPETYRMLLVYSKEVNLATIVEVDLKAPFSLTTIERGKGWCYSCIPSCVFMNNEEHVYIKIYLSFYSRKGPTFYC